MLHEIVFKQQNMKFPMVVKFIFMMIRKQQNKDQKIIVVYQNNGEIISNVVNNINPYAKEYKYLHKLTKNNY